MTTTNTNQPAGEMRRRRPQLVHSARVMFETRLAKYNDPRNLEWDFDDVTDKWERHALSAFMDLQATEVERDALTDEVARLREVLKGLGWEYPNQANGYCWCDAKLTWPRKHSPACEAARAAL